MKNESDYTYHNMTICDIYYNNCILLEQTRLIKLLKVLGQYGDTPLLNTLFKVRIHLRCIMFCMVNKNT